MQQEDGNPQIFLGIYENRKIKDIDKVPDADYTKEAILRKMHINTT